MLVSFIIPALNEEKHLPQCLRSIQALDRPADVAEIETLVIDSQSVDHTATVARELGAKVVTVRPGQVSRSRNAGVRESRGELLAFLDADCELSKDWLLRCFGHLRRSEVLGAGTCIAAPTASAPWVERCWYDLAYRPRKSVESEHVDWLMSFNLLVRRSAFEEVGGFDESLVTCEDSDFGYKLAARGELIKDHVAQTIHHGEAKTLRQFFLREAWRSRGNLPILYRQGLALREMPSLIVPPGFVGALLTGIVFLILGVWWPMLAWWGGALIVAALLLPVLVLLMKGVSPTQPLHFIRCWCVFAVYLCARTVGLVLPIGRVHR